MQSTRLAQLPARSEPTPAQRPFSRLERLWARAAPSIREWLPLWYFLWLPQQYEVCARFQASARGHCFRRLHAQGLIAKIPRTRRWRVTDYGRKVMCTAMYLRGHHFPNVYAGVVHWISSRKSRGSHSNRIYALNAPRPRRCTERWLDVMASTYGTGPVVLRRVLAKLQRAGLVATQRGVGGGSVLARAPETIHLRQAYEPIAEDAPTVLQRHPEGCAGVVAPVLARYVNGLLARLGAVTVAEMDQEVRGRILATVAARKASSTAVRKATRTAAHQVLSKARR